MDAKKAKSYVYYYADNYISLSLLKQMIVFYASWTFICLVFGIADMRFLPYGITLALMTVLYVISVLVFENKSRAIDAFSLRFLVNGISGIFMSLFFIVIAFLFMAHPDFSSVFGTADKIALPVITAILLLVYDVITVMNVKAGKYVGKKQKTNINVIFWSGVGVAIAALLKRVISKSVGNGTAI